MKLSLRRIAVAAALIGSATGADAVSISANGSGQALILPYYTVNGGNSTLLSLRNSTDAVKAVRITFREGRNGAAVLDFNIYLAPHDTWVGAVVGDAEGPARISRSDATCTVPLLPDVPQPFQNFEYSPPLQGDGGPYHLERTREGFVEFIEMGEVFDDADGGFRPATAATPARTQSNENEIAPANCQVLLAAWTPGGRWNTEPHRNIRSPAGGLSANAVIVNAAQGSSFSLPALALSEFFSPSASCAPGCDGVAGQNLHNYFNGIVSDLSSARDADGGATALIRHAGQSYRFRFEGEGAGARAVTALLMRRSLSNEFHASQAALLSSDSEWVLTQPTRYLLQRGASASTRLPFRAAYRGSEVAPYSELQGACETTLFEHWGRDGRPPRREGINIGPSPPTPPPPQLCWTTQVLAFNQAGVGDVLRGGQPSRVLGARYAAPVRPCLGTYTSASTSCLDGATMFEAGSARISFPDERNFLAASSQPIADNPGGANLLTGLPVIGFWVSNFESSGIPGVLANFAVQQPHTGTTAPRAGTVSINAATGEAVWTPQP